MKSSTLSDISDSRANPTSTNSNSESGSNVAAQATSSESTEANGGWAGRWSNLAADHIKRWERRLYVPKSGRDGELIAVRRLAVRIQHLGRREEFRFDTTNRQAAATQALDVFRFLKANGWTATLAKYKPEVEAPKLDTTIGDYLAAVRNTNRLILRTFTNYQNALRTIAAEVFDVKLDKGVSKFDYRSRTGGVPSGNDIWTQKIDSHRLEQLTPDRVTEWKRGRISAAGNSPAAIASTRRTINSHIRCARSLFSPSMIREIKGLTLPATLPFAGVELEENGSMKYVSKISTPALIAAARKELKSRDPEAYKVFLLGMCGGMRKAEIDLLEWRMIDFASKVIRLEQTEWLHLKTTDSAAVITPDPEVLAELRTFKSTSNSQFVVSSVVVWCKGKKRREKVRPPRNDSGRQYYRCQPVFKRLNTWLRAKGINVHKPLHELRKEVGAHICSKDGIYAASRYLRHSDISTTARHYVDQKNRIVVGLGQYLRTKPKGQARKLKPSKA
jgi:integrase